MPADALSWAMDLADSHGSQHIDTGRCRRHRRRVTSSISIVTLPVNVAELEIAASPLPTTKTPATPRKVMLPRLGQGRCRPSDSDYALSVGAGADRDDVARAGMVDAFLNRGHSRHILILPSRPPPTQA